jgi:hypothetical protein
MGRWIDGLMDRWVDASSDDRDIYVVLPDTGLGTGLVGSVDSVCEE